MLHTLWWGDEVKLHAWGKTYTYEVRSAVITTPITSRYSSTKTWTG